MLGNQKKFIWLSLLWYIHFITVVWKQTHNISGLCLYSRAFSITKTSSTGENILPGYYPTWKKGNHPTPSPAKLPVSSKAEKKLRHHYEVTAQDNRLTKRLRPNYTECFLTSHVSLPYQQDSGAITVGFI